MDEVESLFTEHYTNNDRKKAMKFLRPLHQKDSHVITFFVGLFTGSFVTLFCVYAILAHITGMLQSATRAAYMESVYPILSMFALLSLHLFMYGCNLFVWKSTRINYNFIFEFQPSTALKYRDAFLICTSLMTAVVAGMGSVLLLICPLNVFYRPTRYCFLRVMRNIICSPFYKVLMVDFFMADQLTSQVYNTLIHCNLPRRFDASHPSSLLRHVEAAACYFVAGSFKTHRYETCKSGKLYRELAYVISFAPYYWRAMQVRLSIFGRDFSATLLSRRSRHFDGTRKSANVLAVLGAVASEALDLTGFYYSGKPLVTKRRTAQLSRTSTARDSTLRDLRANSVDISGVSGALELL